MKDKYSQLELDQIVKSTANRNGWDFSMMKTIRQPVPWDYIGEVKKWLKPSMEVLDIGTGGGEKFILLAKYYRYGLGTDIDPKMIATAKENSKDLKNIEFKVESVELEGITRKFDVILNRHAPFNLKSITKHLKPGGVFITQQVGEKNMKNVMEVLSQSNNTPTISTKQIQESGLKLLSFREYDVEYVVEDIASLVFWLNALDMLHADIAGRDALSSSDVLNSILKDDVDQRGFVTNEHRYLVVAEK